QRHAGGAALGQGSGRVRRPLGAQVSPDLGPPRTDAPDRLALAAAAVTAALSFTPVADAPGSVFIGGACLFWAVFVLVRARGDRDSFRRWGFRTDKLGSASAPASAEFVGGVAASATFGAW